MKVDGGLEAEGAAEDCSWLLHILFLHRSFIQMMKLNSDTLDQVVFKVCHK